MSIPYEKLEKFIKGEYHSIKCINVYDNRFRINVFTRDYAGVIPINKISQSFFVKYEDGQIIDITRRK